MKVLRLHVLIRCDIRANNLTVSVVLISLINSLWYIFEGINEGIVIRKGNADNRCG